MNKIFGDGWQGTTGLKIVERLEPRKDVELIKLEGDERKDMNARLDAAKLADVTVLCLPDDAARIRARGGAVLFGHAGYGTAPRGTAERKSVTRNTTRALRRFLSGRTYLGGRGVRERIRFGGRESG